MPLSPPDTNQKHHCRPQLLAPQRSNANWSGVPRPSSVVRPRCQAVMAVSLASRRSLCRAPSTSLQAPSMPT